MMLQPQRRKTTCSWCHALCVVEPGVVCLCPDCGHRADVCRMDCDCPRCLPFDPGVSDHDDSYPPLQEPREPDLEDFYR